MTDGFGSLLTRLRTDRGMTQAALAAAAGVSEAHVSYLESGGRQPRRALIARLVGALDEAGPVLPEEAAALYWAAGFVPPQVDVSIMRALIAASR